MIKGKRILITGFVGSIGSELTKQLINENEICGIDNNETALFDFHEDLHWRGFKLFSIIGDIRDRHAFKKVLWNFGNPDIIFHCAALKHITPSAWSPDEYIKTNIYWILSSKITH